MKRLLLYNWERINGTNGGGVTQYVTELIEGLIEDGTYEIFFLNSGRKYTVDGIVRIEKTDNSFGEKVHSYEVFNSPVLSPGNQSAENFKKFVSDESLHILIEDFIRTNNIQVVHYHNIEGLTQKILKLKKNLLDVKFICTLHNYYPICPEVNLWKDDKEICVSCDSNDCLKCYPYANYDLTRFRFQHLDIPGLKDIFLDYSIEHPDSEGEDSVKRFRNGNIEALNTCFDAVLVPSVSTKEVYASRGLKPDVLRVSYVGSKIADYAIKRKNDVCPKDGILNILYMGYLRSDKGFYFLLDGLKKLPSDIASRIHVTFLVRHKDLGKEIELVLKEKMGQYAGVECVNGYKDHSELKHIMGSQDLGIIPIQWEDPLPRIAMEQIACGVPVLASTLGGTKEIIGDNPDFLFTAGDVEEFIAKLSSFVEHKEKLEDFWQHSKQLRTMEEHIRELKAVYEE